MPGLSSPSEGDHKYVSPPEACNCFELLKQTDEFGETENTGSGFIFTNTESIFEQELLPVTVTKYLVVDNGDAIGLGISGLLNNDAGDHEYIFPPDAKI